MNFSFSERSDVQCSLVIFMPTSSTWVIHTNGFSPAPQPCTCALARQFPCLPVLHQCSSPLSVMPWWLRLQASLAGRAVLRHLPSRWQWPILWIVSR